MGEGVVWSLDSREANCLSQARAGLELLGKHYVACGEQAGEQVISNQEHRCAGRLWVPAGLGQRPSERLGCPGW